MKKKTPKRELEFLMEDLRVDEKREAIFNSLIKALNKLDDKSFKEVFTKDVKLTELDLSEISGIEDLRTCFIVILGMINYSNIEPSMEIFPPFDKNETNAFIVIISDVPTQDHLFVYKMILRGWKIASIETVFNEFFTNYKKYL